jgi:signal transduction histidine kinase
LNAALDEKLQGNYSLQKEYLDKAIEKSALINVDHYKFLCYHDYVVFAAQQGKKELATKYYEKIKDVYPTYKKSVFHTILFLEVKAYNQYALKNYKTAERFALEKLKLSESFNSKEILQEAHELLELIYTASGQTVKAKEQDYIVLNYLNNTKENSLKNQLVYYQTLYETEKRDLTIKNQQANIALLDSKNKIKTQWLLFGGLGLLSVFGFVWIIRSRNFVRKKQKLQEKFSQDILNTQEEERSRVAKELHDGVGQQLLVLKNTFLQKEPQEKEEIKLLENTIREVREISHNLYPFQFKKLGLVKSLEHMMDAFQKSSQVFYSYDIEDISGRITKEKELFIYRMLQECISNVEKHSAATACNLTVKSKNSQMQFQLKDNGKGFSVETINTTKTSLGIRSLKERAQYMNAELDIKSVKEKGTTITIKITD